MARESMRKRHERRLGRPERMIDRLLSEQWVSPSWWKQDYTMFGIICKYFIEELKKAVPVDATNVCSFWQSEEDRRNGSAWDINKDFPSFRPPFPNMFIECTGSISDHPSSGRQWGALVSTDNVVNSINKYGKIKTEIPDGTSLVTLFTLFIIANEKIFAPSLTSMTFMDELGNILETRANLFMPGNLAGTPEDLREAERFLLGHLSPIFLAISFMNCKNVSIDSVEPNPKLNRKRKNNGLNPFVRYHTINIEPMKQALKTEGGIETNGLKRALHICRGHFATYRESFLGRPLEKPVTVWRPSHVRGSAKEGVVISDYKVNAPKESIK